MWDRATYISTNVPVREFFMPILPVKDPYRKEPAQHLIDWEDVVEVDGDPEDWVDAESRIDCSDTHEPGVGHTEEGCPTED